MNALLAVAVGGVMLVLIGRSLFNLINDAQLLDARNRQIALFTVVAVMLGFVATIIIVRAVRVG